MPTRTVGLAILSFWLATTGWTLYREYGGSLWHDEPPPYTIDLADEVRAAVGTIDWQIFKDNEQIGKYMTPTKPIGTAWTEVKYLGRDDLFELYGKFDFQVPIAGLAEAVVQLSSAYRVTREGELRAVDANISATFTVAFLGEHRHNTRATIAGPVRDHRFFPVLTIRAPIEREIKLNSVGLSSRGNVLNPLHPVNRILGIRPGQRWPIPVVDPLSQALSGELQDQLGGQFGQPGVQMLQAEVMENGRFLPFEEQMVLCQIIRYYGDDMNACTWVRQSDGLVLQQEVSSTAQGCRLILKRKPQPRPPSATAW